MTKKVGDRFQTTDVELGVSNDKYVEVLKGLDEGEVIVMNPIALMTEEEKREAFRSGTGTAKKAWGPEGPAEPGKAEGAEPGRVRWLLVPPRSRPGLPRPARRVTLPRPRRKPRARVVVVAPWQEFSRRFRPKTAQMKTATPEERAEILKKAGHG